MSVLTYRKNNHPRPLPWLHGEIKTPPFSPAARIEAGVFLRRLQEGETLGLPHSRPMPMVGVACHELRIVDAAQNWRIVYHISKEAIVILEVFSKKSGKTPRRIIQTCQRRLQAFLRGY